MSRTLWFTPKTNRSQIAAIYTVDSLRLDLTNMQGCTITLGRLQSERAKVSKGA